MSVSTRRGVNKLYNDLGFYTAKLPETKEELELFTDALRHPKTGVDLEQKLDLQNIHHSAFSGRNLVTWIMKYFHFSNRAQAVEICNKFQARGAWRGMNGSVEFRDSSQSFYCFPEDEFDEYIKNLSDEQLGYVFSLIIGPLGVRATNQGTDDAESDRPIPGSKLIGWLLRRFSDIRNRAEAARFLNTLLSRGYLRQTEGNMYYLNMSASNPAIAKSVKDAPLDICGICKMFTGLLSFQVKVTLSCGHKFHRSCLSELQNYEMGRCIDCDANISTIKTNSELDLIIPFITKILDSPLYAFKKEIEEWVNKFNARFSLFKKSRIPSGSDSTSKKASEPTEVLQKALEDLSIFIVKLNDELMDDLSILKKHQHGREQCLLTLKKFIIPKIYSSLFPLYRNVNAEKDRKLYEKIKLLQPISTPESLDIDRKFRLTETNNRNNSNSVSAASAGSLNGISSGVSPNISSAASIRSATGTAPTPGNWLTTSGTIPNSGNGLSASGTVPVGGNGLAASGTVPMNGNTLAASGTIPFSGNGLSAASGTVPVSGNGLAASGTVSISAGDIITGYLDTMNIIPHTSPGKSQTAPTSPNAQAHRKMNPNAPVAAGLPPVKSYSKNMLLRGRSDRVFQVAESNDSSALEAPTPSIPYALALEEFDRLNDYTDVYDKLNCLILTCHYITDAIIAYWKTRGQFKVDDLVVSSDELLLILSYITIHSNVPHLFSELNFIDDFIDEVSLDAEPGFCKTTLETALKYISENLDPDALPGNSNGK